MGFAIQVALLRYPGWSYTSFKYIPENVIKYIAKQVGTVPKALKYYAKRENTIWNHLQEIRSHYGLNSSPSTNISGTFKKLNLSASLL